ncbi:GNAT family N-acetyltransferase [Tenggerimyces flavus]|uniref:GNAT family N-acetyltransferase n=1 Tax=Tenggerimyces flavus TaxID=1708749 RepID=A0ABV7Y680_9ACTN|nr:GNAT family N-acetyltransferase [Tenggerimyces flavus]MBM7788319.1 GNAT superfamily N-acetyltransferase [Tenggerimyces flavus]
MADLRIERLTTDEMLEDWRHVHNVIVPPAALSLAEVRERAHRNVLEVAYLDDVLVGCTTIRAPDEDGAVTVIARVLPEHRRQGIGGRLYARALEQAAGARVVETVVLESNADGLAFALKHGFVEVERYALPGETARWIDLRLS